MHPESMFMMLQDTRLADDGCPHCGGHGYWSWQWEHRDFSMGQRWLSVSRLPAVWLDTAVTPLSPETSHNRG